VRLVKDAMRAADIISKVSLLFKKDVLQRELVAVSELAREMIVCCAASEPLLVSIPHQTCRGSSQVIADRVHCSSLHEPHAERHDEAMKEMGSGSELVIKFRNWRWTTANLGQRYGCGIAWRASDQIFGHSLRPKTTALVWGCPSVARSLSRMAGVCGH